jgi:uncharacterized protein
VTQDRSTYYLPDGLPGPVPEKNGLSAAFWQGLQTNRLLLQHCAVCGAWQFGAEWICHHCHAFDLVWNEVVPRGRIYSWERVWHPVHPCLASTGPYIVVLVELPQAGGVRLVGNLLGDPRQDVLIEGEVEGVFEHHSLADPPFTLLQWRPV